MQARKTGIINATYTFAVDKSYGIHPHQGIPQLHFDQLNVIAQHLQSIKADNPQASIVHNIHDDHIPSDTPKSPPETSEQPQSFTLS
jgi:hypothetical protein